MREIKFRAWDEHIEAMVSPEDMQLDGSGLVARYYQNCDDEESIWVTDSISLKGIILLQYTGLKDKNGVEVYEGDIGKFNGYICKLEWDEKAARFWWIDIITDQWILGRPSDAEVIGNIYENPELLEE